MQNGRCYMRYLITFSYDGTNYNGYQRQPNVKTIEDEIEKVLYKINGNNAVIIHATGRTDAHVHAINQKAHFDLLLEIPNSNLKKAMNSLLPGDIYIKNVEKAVIAKDKKEATDALAVAIKRIDKAFAHGVVTSNFVARNKSRLTKKVNEME